VAVFVHGLLGVALVLAMIVFVPGYKRMFQQMFRDHEMGFPYLTIKVVEVSDWFVAYWYVAVLAALPMLVVDGAIVYWCWSRKSTRIVGVLWIILLILFWLLFVGFAALGLWFAHLKLQEALAR